MAWLTNEQNKAKLPKGDTLVWLTSLGLTIGITMVVALLLVIVYKGVQVFWPSKVMEVTLSADEAEALPGDIPKLAGEFVKRGERNVNDPKSGPVYEVQIFTGNKDSMGQSFRYVLEDSIQEKTYPPELLVAEREEYGDAIFYPVAVQRTDGTRVEAGDAQFRQLLDERIRHYKKVRKEILAIEKKEIGAINRKIRQLNLDLRGLTPGTPEMEANTAQTAELQAQYEKLAAQSGTLRATLEEEHLVYRTSTGIERTQPLGSIYDLYAPNQLSFWQRFGMFFQHIWHFVSEDPRESNTEGGIFPAIFGTFVMTLIMSIVVTPFGVVAAIYLREYAKQGVMVRTVRICVNNLAGVPSIVFGVFGLAFFVYFLGDKIDQNFFSSALPTPTFGTGGIMWASATLALLTLPVVIVATEEALAAVPRGVREASLACGASKWQTIQRVVLPSAAPGVLTGLILAMARGAGEVAPLMIVGVVKLAPSLPLDTTAPFIHPERKFMHLGFHIYDLAFQSPDSEAAKPILFATTMLLILLVVVLNLGAILIRDRLRKKYAGGAF